MKMARCFLGARLSNRIATVVSDDLCSGAVLSWVGSALADPAGPTRLRCALHGWTLIPVSQCGLPLPQIVKIDFVSAGAAVSTHAVETKSWEGGAVVPELQNNLPNQ